MFVYKRAVKKGHNVPPVSTVLDGATRGLSLRRRFFTLWVLSVHRPFYREHKPKR